MPLTLFILPFTDAIKKNGFSIVDKVRNLDNEIEISFDDGYFGIFENIDFFEKAVSILKIMALEFKIIGKYLEYKK